MIARGGIAEAGDALGLDDLLGLVQPGVGDGLRTPFGCLRGRGLPVLGQSSKGDLIVRVHVWTPERLSAEQERLFRELSQLEGDPPKRSPGFWSKLKEALGA